MNGVHGETIEKFLSNYGWRFEKESDISWVTGWQGDNRSFPLKLELTDTWLSLLVQPLFKMDQRITEWPELMELLLEMNHDCQMIKVSLDENSNITLEIQLFCSNLNYDTFADTLGILGYYAELVYTKLSAKMIDMGYYMRPQFQLLT